MPEGHKTHALAIEHTELFGGQSIKVTSPQGRFRADARKVSGRVLERCEAFGKHLFYHFEGNRLIHIHLGRYGKYRLHSLPVPQPVGQVRMRMVGEQQALDLNGPSTCRVIDFEQREGVLSRLGPDPLAGGKKADVFARIRSSSKPIGALILDQAVVSGVGNIFRAELFFEIGLDPNTPGDKLSKADFDALWKSLLRMMRVGKKYGKIITVTAKEAGVPLAKLEGSDRFRIYGHVSCCRCESEVETLKLAARKLYWCPSCQGG
ncbi:MAG: DNA-formamidopyrimidine glycosylase family protein [Planctomycetota bacterium]